MQHLDVLICNATATQHHGTGRYSLVPEGMTTAGGSHGTLLNGRAWYWLERVLRHYGSEGWRLESFRASRPIPIVVGHDASLGWLR